MKMIANLKKVEICNSKKNYDAKNFKQRKINARIAN